MSPTFQELDTKSQADVNAEVASLAALRAAFISGVEGKSGTRPGVSKDDLRALAALQDVLFEHAFSSHRRLLGLPIILMKRLVVAVMNRLLKIVLVRQFELNHRQWAVALAVNDMERRLAVLEKRLAESVRERN